ncbi:hypothetical protein C8F04DRAFT_1197029 [Mycena alexandri]|uniref:Uncharacterized protein n=1 Tax=Mycena alexandri TaxID=1745969 RepID=A0AAD6S2P1_9AGAR|nr:hypothetical protein C8F04DRAFT_1197029 [Mycena alexandri]
MAPGPLPPSLPPLPDNLEGWSANTDTAYNILSAGYTHARGVLHQEGGDPVRYRLVSSNIVETLVPLLERMDVDGVPRPWIETCAYLFGPLVYELQVSALAAEGVHREHDEIELLQPVTEIHSGRPGRPQKIIDPAYLAEATTSGRNIKRSDLASALGIHRHTLRKRLRQLGLNTKFDNLTDEELDTLTRGFKAKKPTSGLRYLRGNLRKNVLDAEFVNRYRVLQRHSNRLWVFARVDDTSIGFCTPRAYPATQDIVPYPAAASSWSYAERFFNFLADNMSYNLLPSSSSNNPFLNPQNVWGGSSQPAYAQQQQYAAQQSTTTPTQQHTVPPAPHAPSQPVRTSRPLPFHQPMPPAFPAFQHAHPPPAHAFHAALPPQSAYYAPHNPAAHREGERAVFHPPMPHSVVTYVALLHVHGRRNGGEDGQGGKRGV